MHRAKLFLAVLIALTLPVKAEVVSGSFYSPALGVQKSYRVYVPAGYASSTKQFPVIYLLHGWGVTESYWSETLQLAAAAQAVGLDALVVMPDGDRSYYANSLTRPNYEACLAGQEERGNPNEPRSALCVHRANYEDYIVRDLVSHIDQRFRTVRAREGRAISGESAGGFGAMTIAMRNKQLFASVAAHSAFLSLLYDGPRPFVAGQVTSRSAVDATSMPAPAVLAFGTTVERWRAHDPVSLAGTLRTGELKIYFDCGTEDEYKFLDEAKHLSDELTRFGLDHEFHAVPGRHDDSLWKTRILHSLRFHKRSFAANP